LAFKTLSPLRAILFPCAQRNVELETQVSQLQAQLIELQQRVNETEILAALVDFSRSNPESTYKAASVIGRDPSPFLHYIIINRGSNDDIRAVCRL
jgi:rod shape-determining protein MreC